ncbi:MAG: hypothetical protein GXP19_03370 [Gammaproteobacteria bacterium]|nr:hypothetical protein [Gammaproteobacteria bacterium]
MKINKRKPDFILVLAVLVGIGVIITMKAQAGAESGVVVNKVEGKALYHDAWTKINNKANQQIVRN